MTLTLGRFTEFHERRGWTPRSNTARLPMSATFATATVSLTIPAVDGAPAITWVLEATRIPAQRRLDGTVYRAERRDFLLYKYTGETKPAELDRYLWADIDNGDVEQLRYAMRAGGGRVPPRAASTLVRRAEKALAA